ncbi:zinc finger CCCH domain-containing protein 23-like [Curcuma longa]|uniref:zinc finger CCCH domain-containing protein 23-like n=1 Tax=Curcuma longa TaxID=136217 RepID=UPI003D9E9683
MHAKDGAEQNTGRSTAMRRHGILPHSPTVQIPAWFPFDDPTATVPGGDGIFDETAVAALRREAEEEEEEGDAVAMLSSGDVIYASDDFRMYEFKVRRCGRGRNHDWTECPFAHPGEKARRRDPRTHRYSGAACPAFRKGAGGCERGDACEFAHGVFECWLHPDRYRTQPCKDGPACRRRVCFFAHTPEQLRVPPSPKQRSLPSFSKSSPTSILAYPPMSPPRESPPISPNKEELHRMWWQSSAPVNEIVASMRQLQLGGTKSTDRSCSFHGGFASPRANDLSCFGNAGFNSLPSTPAADATAWTSKDEAAAERVESGRALRAKMLERLSKDGVGSEKAEATPDVDWVSELLK